MIRAKDGVVSSLHDVIAQNLGTVTVTAQVRVFSSAPVPGGSRCAGIVIR